jgi:glycosidase
MNYIFRNAVQDYAAGGPAKALVTQLEHLREAYPPQAHAALMNLLSSHDQARSLHHFGWKDEARDSPEVVGLAKQKLRLAVFMQMTYPGAPTVYYGDEVGVTGGDDPYNRATYPWPDEGGKPDLALREDFKRLIALRHALPVLRRGTLDAPLHVDEHVVVMLRRLDNAWAVVAWNNAPEARTVTVALPEGAPAAWRDALAAQGAAGTPASPTAGRLTVTVPGRFGVVLASP